jgi:multidrug resistance protein, MATE family
MLSRWSAPYGYRRVLSVSLPLVASMASVTVMHFTDRLFLANYSVEAIAAAGPAGMTSFMFMSFFMGVAGYVNTFVAQYTGARRPGQVGAALWQGIYFTLGSGFILASLYLVTPWIFAMVGHDPAVQRLEVVYFQILTLGAGFNIMSWTLSTFYSGRGLTNVIMLVSMTGALLNVPLDYALINGLWGLPEMGIAGAALATVAASALITLIYALLIFTRANDQAYGVRRAYAFNSALFTRLMRFGLPNGVQFWISMASYTFFFLLVGRLGREELAASNIAFALEHLCFLPMVGFHQGTIILAGQAIGAGKPDHAAQSAISTLHIALLYMGSMAMIFMFLPGPLMDLFRERGVNPDEYAVIRDMGTNILRLMALYTMFDALGLVYSAVLKGAGDTMFVMWMVGVLSLVIMILPTWWLLQMQFEHGLVYAWLLAATYTAAVALAFYLRFRQGAWRSMKVIETTA